MSEPMRFFAVTAPGLEGPCGTELEQLGVAGIRSVAGGVEFDGGLRELYLASLHLGVASRILVRVGEVKTRDFPELFQRTVRLPWGRFIRPGMPLQVRAVSHRSRLLHTGRIAETVAEAIAHSLGQAAPVAPRAGEPMQLVLARFEDDRCLLSVDSSGELLHRRGYREEGGAAPLRETLATGILHLLGWDGSSPLADPLCGSGTFVIEAALLASRRPPGGGRTFAFMHWPKYRPGLWQSLVQEAERRQQRPGVSLTGSDRDAAVVAQAIRNADRAGVADLVNFTQSELQQLTPSSVPGLVVVNPPYGNRLGGDVDLAKFYRRMGKDLPRAFPQWRIALLAPDQELARSTGLPLGTIASLENGGIHVGLYATP